MDMADYSAVGDSFQSTLIQKPYLIFLDWDKKSKKESNVLPTVFSSRDMSAMKSLMLMVGNGTHKAPLFYICLEKG